MLAERPSTLALESAWEQLSSFLFVPRTEQEYDQLVEHLNLLIETTKGNPDHPLALLLSVVGIVMGHYEDEHYPDEMFSTED